MLTHLPHIVDSNRFGGLIGGEADIIDTTDWRIIMLPQALFLLAYSTTWLKFIRSDKTFENLVLFALVGYLSYFTFAVGVHENHLFPAMVLATVLYWLDKERASNALIIAIAGNLNLVLFYGLTGAEPPLKRTIGGVDLALVISLLIVSFFLQMWTTTVFKRSRVVP